VVGGALYWGFEGRAERTYSLSKGEAEKVVFTDIFRFGASFWFITCLCVTFYSAMFPFQTFAVKFFMDKHLQAMPPDAARAAGGFLSSLLTLSAMILTPLFGLLVDKVGRRSLFMLLGSMLIIPVYLAMNYVVLAPAIPPEALQVFAASDTGGLSLVAAVSRWLGGLGAMIKILVLYYPNLLIPMAVMGMAFSLVPAVMWPSVAYVVDQPRLGTAYGLMTMIQNIGLAGFNMLIGWANDYSHAGAGAPGGYALGMWVFSSLGFLGLVFAFLLRRCERGPRGHGLETIRA
jgi:MFS family permease